MTSIDFAVSGWSAWAPRLETEAAWYAWAGAADIPDLPAAPPAVPVLLRRRVSRLGQHALKAAWSLPDRAIARMVFSSRHGEFERTLSILDALVGRIEVSPADFTLSVHNALVGLLSIAANNRSGHTMIAAGTESFGFGMLEALACLRERPDEPVIMVHFDESLPPPFDVFDTDPPPPVAVALTLTAATGTKLSLTTAPSDSQPAPGAQPVMAFMAVLLGAVDSVLTAGEQRTWRWSRDALD